MEKKNQTACNVLYTYTYSTPPPFNCGEQIVRQYMVGWENLSIIAPQQTNKIVPVRKAGATTEWYNYQQKRVYFISSLALLMHLKSMGT